MSKLMTAANYTAAEALAARAHAWMQEHVPGYRAERWDIPHQHRTNGQWAVAWDERLVAEFAEDPPTIIDRSPEWAAASPIE